MKKFLFFMVAALLTAGGKTMAQTVKSASVPTGYGGSVQISYEVVSEEDKTCKIVRKDTGTGAISMQYNGKFDLPTVIDGYDVVGIGKYAFGNTRCIITKLPQDLTTIEEYAFTDYSDANMRPSFGDTLYINEWVTDIKPNAFRKSHVNYVVMAEGGTYQIPNYAFAESNINGITLSSTITNIGASAFQNSKLRKIRIPEEGLETISNDAFAFSNIDTLRIPYTCSQIYTSITRGCNDLVSLTVAPGNLNYDDTKNVSNVIYEISRDAIVAACNRSGIPSTTKRIDESAFANLTGFNQIYIPESLTDIGMNAFSSSGIKYLLIPATVQHIWDGAFSNCDSLERVDFMGNCKDMRLGSLAISLSSSVKDNPKLTGVYFHDIYPPRVDTQAKNNFFKNLENVNLYYPTISGVNYFYQTGGYYNNVDHNPVASFFKTGLPYKVINRVDITDYEWPTAGKVGDYDVTSTTTGVKNVAVKYIMYSRVLDMHEEKFAPNESWLVRMDVFLDNGYVFELPQTYIDGKVQDVRITRSGRDDEQHFGWQATPIIPAGGVPVESLSCELPAPVVGETPAEYITSPNPDGRYFARTYFGKYGGQITWTPLHVSFREDVVYTAKIKVSCGEDYTFSKDLVPTVNGKSAQLIQGETDATGRCHEATISYTFHVTKAIPDGDVDGNGLLNSADVVSVYNYIIDGDASGIDKSTANVDGDTDGNVNSADVVAIYNYIINGATYHYSYNGIEIPMVNVEGGPFIMGAPDDDSDAYDYEKPQHRVTLSPFAIGATEVTQKLWTAVMGSNPSNFEGEDNPVEMVSWDDCLKFIKKLNEDFGDKLGDKQFRLPTEAEWEYAARGGQQSKEYKYIGGDDPDEVAWYGDNSNDETHPVAQKKPNELGIYDMAGNVWEWCWDWFDDYPSTSQTDPTGPATGMDKTERGGNYFNTARELRPSRRISCDRTKVYDNLGLRLVLSNIILSE